MGIAEKQKANDVPSRSPLKATMAAAENSQMLLAIAAAGSIPRATRINLPRAKDVVAGPGKNPDPTSADLPSADKSIDIESKPETYFRPAFAPEARRCRTAW